MMILLSGKMLSALEETKPTQVKVDEGVNEPVAEGHSYATVEELLEHSRNHFVEDAQRRVNRALISYAVAVNKRTKELKEGDAAPILEEERKRLSELLHKRTHRLLHESLELVQTQFAQVETPADHTVEQVKKDFEAMVHHYLEETVEKAVTQ